MQQQRRASEEVIHGLEITSAKIRALAQEGYDRTEIAAFLGVRYQHVRQVLLDAGITVGLRKRDGAGRGGSPKRILVPVAIPTLDEFHQGYLAFRAKERRDAMYKTATFLVRHFWGKPAEIADGLGVLLLTWNNAHYRYGSFDFQLLEKTLADNQQLLASFRNRDIFSYAPADDPSITSLFGKLLEALRICEGKKKGVASPVAVAKALHLLAPGYFPLWDLEIAKAYGCGYSQQPAAQYVAFLRKMKQLAERLTTLGATLGDSAKTALKVLDEYNYAKYTKHWT
jgi:hypothetical protein